MEKFRVDIGGTARIFQETFGISIEYRGPSGEYREDIGGSRGNLGRIVKDIGGNSGGTSGKFWRISGEPRGYFRRNRTFRWKIEGKIGERGKFAVKTWQICRKNGQFWLFW